MAVVQTNYDGTSGGTSVAVAFSSNPTAGNFLVFTGATEDENLTSCATSQSDSVVEDVQNDGPSKGRNKIFHVASAVGGATTVTLNCSPSNFPELGIMEFDDTLNSVDGTAISNGSGTTATTNSVTATGDGISVAVMCNTNSGTITEDGTWTLVGEDEAYSFSGGSSVYKYTSSGSISHSWTKASGTHYTSIVVYLLAGGGGATPKGPLGMPLSRPFSGPLG